MGKVGRPTIYSEELAEAIALRLEEGESMRQICEDADMPHRTTLRLWCRENPDFSARCATARRQQSEDEFEALRDIEDKTLSGEYNAKASSVVLASKQWRLSKLQPKVYGQVSRHELSGPDGAPLPAIQVNLSPPPESSE